MAADPGRRYAARGDQWHDHALPCCHMEERFFLVLAGVVLAALLGGWLASYRRSVLGSLCTCLGVALLLALGVLWLAQATDTQGFAALLVIGTFMFCSVIGFSTSLALRRLRRVYGKGVKGTTTRSWSDQAP